MKRISVILSLLIFVITAGLFAPRLAAANAPARIVSLAPAATEILYDLGLGDKVVAVTKYCSWPPEAKSKQMPAEMLHVNMESIVAMKPDLVVISNMNEHLKPRIEALGLPLVVVNQDDFGRICDSMIRVGKACGIEGRAVSRVAELKGEVKKLTDSAGKSDKRVLIVVGRDIADTSFKRVYVAGKRSFYENLLKESGVRNAFESDAPYAQIAREGLLRLNPDFIIELIGEHGMTNIKTSEVFTQWEKLSGLKAVRNGSVAVIRGDFTFRAGPRYPRVLSVFQSILRGKVREIQE
ncbi:ABC transporter substrate-binding protein [Synergistales bacterium]|nr:ABC transporter substrate-binding protein [Synergistales bacterium]